MGTVLDGLYRLDGLLGAGGVGAVYSAWHLNVGRAVAVKLLHPQFAQHAEPLQRFIREAQYLSRLGHPSFVSVYDFSYAPDGTAYLVMEMVSGQTLRARLQQGPLSPAETLAMMRPVCEALEQAHAQQILHRDLKPDNLMLVADGGVKILDFGMAKLLSDQDPLTQAKVVMGTPQYLSPERARGHQGVDHRSDIFALGAILYEALSGRMAFSGETAVATMYKVIRDPVPPLELADKDLGQLLDQVIAVACAKDPRGRYGSAMEMFGALEGALVGKAVESTAAELEVPEAKEAPEGAMKAGIFHATLDYIRRQYGEEGLQSLGGLFGQERLDKIMNTLPTSWVPMAELHDLHLAIVRLFDDGSLAVMRNLGRYFAEMALSTVYKAFLSPGNPETFVRRAQIIFGAWSSQGETKIDRIDERSWRLQIRGASTAVSGPLMAASAGGVERYLELAGATDVSVKEAILDEEGMTVGDMRISFIVPSDS